MTPNVDLSLRTGLGPRMTAPTVIAGTVGASVTPVTLPTVAQHQFGASVFRLQITNGHASQLLAWQIVAHGAAAPVFTASYATGGGVIVLPGTTRTETMHAGFDLYIIGSNTNTSFCIDAELQN